MEKNTVNRKQVGVWTAVGIGVGVAMGAAMDSMAMWICIGTVLGVFVDMALGRRR
jgi:hypothetical protein